jgi:hypothetical protein
MGATFSREIRENLIFPGTNERSKYFEVRIFRRMNSFAWRGTDHFSRSTEFLFSRLMHSDRIQRSLATNLTGFATLRKWQKRYLSRGRPTRYIGGYWVRRNVISAADVLRGTSAAIECAETLPQPRTSHEIHRRLLSAIFNFFSRKSADFECRPGNLKMGAMSPV